MTDRPDPSSDSISCAGKVLRDRARALSRPPEPLGATGASIELLEFSLAKERYAVETKFIREVHPFGELTPLPCTPPFVLGIVNIRGHILPVLDIKKFFNLPDQGLTDLHCIILVHDDDLELGLLADAIVGVRSIPVDSLRPPLPTLTGIQAEFLAGVTEECLVVLDLERILGDPKIIVLEEVEI